MVHSHSLSLHIQIILIKSPFVLKLSLPLFILVDRFYGANCMQASSLIDEMRELMEWQW